MKNWWKRRSLKLRLTLWYAAAMSGILLALAPFVCELIELRLHAELDRQLRIDSDLIAAQLEPDSAGRIRWRAQGALGNEGSAPLTEWFEVWSEEKELLLRQRPLPAGPVEKPLQPPADPRLQFYSVEKAGAPPIRVMDRPAQVQGRGVILRVFRDETDMHRTLREILACFALGVPLAACLSALGGYLVAGRSLAPVAAMAEQARRITSESLGRRLPISNPHDELGQLATVFNQTLQHLEDSFAALQRFTADASHELRTPLTALRSVGEVGLRDAADSQALRETIGSMLEEAQKLNDLTDTLLLLARAESGRSPASLEPVRVKELLADVSESVGVLATEKQQCMELLGEANLVAMADRVLLRQAVINILDNAIRYSPVGSRVILECFAHNGQAVIEVTDQGPGITAEYHQKIFERFFRIDQARSRSEGGAGLGLAIARLSMAQQGGSIDLQSEVGKGSRFRLVLPR